MVDAVDEKTATIKIPRHFPPGEIVAFGVSDEDYMEQYAGEFHEWIEGVVVKMAPASLNHNSLSRYLLNLFQAYFSLQSIGTVEHAPLVMRLDTSRREPDLQIILNENLDRLHETYMDGPADICIEIVSPSNEDTDYGAKFREYEQGGVREYWLIDPQRSQCIFYRLNDKGIYQSAALDDGQHYSSPLLPKLRLHVPTLWQKPLPNIIETVALVQEMVTSI